MTTVIEIRPERAVFNAGQFDTDFRYLRTTAAGVMTTMLAGPSIAVAFDASGGLISYRYECGSHVINASGGPTVPSDVVNTPTGIAL